MDARWACRSISSSPRHGTDSFRVATRSSLTTQTCRWRPSMASWISAERLSTPWLRWFAALEWMLGGTSPNHSCMFGLMILSDEKWYLWHCFSVLLFMSSRHKNSMQSPLTLQSNFAGSLVIIIVKTPWNLAIASCFTTGWPWKST